MCPAGRTPCTPMVRAASSVPFGMNISIASRDFDVIHLSSMQTHHYHHVPLTYSSVGVRHPFEQYLSTSPRSNHIPSSENRSPGTYTPYTLLLNYGCINIINMTRNQLREFLTVLWYNIKLDKR